MGWALENLSADARQGIAETLFEVQRTEGHWLNGLCPFHEDRNASFGYNIAEDYYKCLAACCESGDLIDLWCLKNGYPARSQDGFKAFKRQFAAETGLGAPNRKTPGQLKPKPKKEPEGPRKTIPEDVYKAFGPVPDAMYSELRIRRGWSREVIDQLGIRLLDHYRKAASPYKVFPIPERRRLAIPIRDDAGTLWNIRTYYPFSEDIPPEGRKILSWANGHGHARLFPAPGLLRPEGPVILCEGEADTICAISHGLNALTQTSKTTYWPEDHAKALVGRDVYIAYDADKPGQEYAQKAAKSLHKLGCSVYLIEWPDYMGRLENGEWPDDHGQDLTDFFVKHGKDANVFLGLMERARKYPDKAAAAPAEIMQPWARFFRTSASGRWSFSERLLADYLVETQPMLYHDKSGQLYHWEGTFFEPWSEEKLRKAAIDALGEEATASRVNASCSLAMSLTSTPHGRDINDMPEWVCLKNGMLNLYQL